MGETDNDIDPRDNGYGTNGVRQTEINEVSERLHGAGENYIYGSIARCNKD